ncbi:hypothetical protein AB1Y20_020152 [Prymnesium parvum]|uniref:Uncharacterized protein n=1 Tax=Prymnesium parvum TaxID=97485 RepID=A0AB34JUD7_PRYPA
MRRGALLLLAALAIGSASGWALLDGLAALWGSPPLHQPALLPPDAPLHDVEHVECRTAAFGCLPSGGCVRTLAGCKPRVGHYWATSEAAADAGWGAVGRFFTPPPPTRIMTRRGLMDVKAGLFYASYTLLEAEAPPPSHLPLLLYQILVFVCIPLIFILLMRALTR